MLPVQNAFSHLLETVEGWTHSSKSVIIVTLFIFAAIPLTVIGVVSLGTFSSRAETTAPNNLSPNGSTVSTSPVFSWNCQCSSETFRLQLREGDDDFNSGSWQKNIVANGVGVTTTRFGGFEPFNYPTIPNALTVGKTYYWRVSCSDFVCLSSKSTSFLVTAPDSEKPSVPAGLRISDFNQNSFSLVWEKSSDNIGVKKYQVLVTRGSASPTTVSTTESTYQVFNFVGGEKYSFAVAAVDLAGNISDFSEKIYYTTPDKDTDRDGFSDTKEIYLGTNPNLACHSSRSWPPDLNDDGVVDQQDLSTITRYIGSSQTRYDLNQNGKIDSADVQIVQTYSGQKC